MMKSKYLKLGALFCGLSGVAFASSTLEQLGVDQKGLLGGVANSVGYYDESGNLLPRSASLQVEESGIIHFKIGATTLGTGVDYLSGYFLALDKHAMEVSYLSLTPESFIVGMGQRNQQPVELTVAGNAPIGESQQLNARPDPNTEPFPILPIRVNILKHSDGGNIEVTGPDAVSNKLTAIAVSLDDTLDNVPMTIKVTNAQNVAKVHLEFKSVDPAITTTERTTCDITDFTNAMGSCAINVTPHKPGNTRIEFDLKHSWWASMNDKNKPISYESINHVNTNVGTLYAGYKNDTVARKWEGSKLQTINVLDSGEKPAYGIGSFVLMAKGHKLYAIDGNKLRVIDNLANPTMTHSNISYNWTGIQESALSMSPTNQENQLLIGSSAGEVYLVSNLATTPVISPSHSFVRAVNVSGFDAVTNLAYFADKARYVSYYNSDNKTWTTIDDEGKFDVFSAILIAAYNNIAYIAGANTRSGNSDLFYIEGNTVKSLTIENNPFVIHNNISTLFTSHNGELYAGTTKGEVYKGKIVGGGKMAFTPLTDDKGSIINLGAPVIDAAYDSNEYLYLATSANGISRVGQGKIVTRLTMYNQPVTKENTVSAVVIDNNDF